ncbi:MAG: hypothetical protein QG671_1719, partial [Actinomycetota bacterium]|nr:hypothetical protein [Actinomycetota bacterium]
MSTTTDSLPPESPTPESPAGAHRPDDGAECPAEGARSGAEDGWAVPGVTTGSSSTPPRLDCAP